MSGLANIQNWAEDNIDFSEYEDANKLYDDMSETFEADNRLPLDKILKDEKQEFIDFLQEEIDKQIDLRDTELVDGELEQFIEDPQPQEPPDLEPEDLEEEEEENIIVRTIKSGISLIRGLFGR